MARWGMVIDLDRCTACQACVVACQVENNVAPPTAAQATRGRAISWLRLVPFKESEHGTRPGLRLVPLPCMHCERPPCTKVCPVQATQIDKEGLVAQVYPRCIGCRYCTTACPYTVRHFNWETPEWPGADGRGAQPRRLRPASGRRGEVQLLPPPAPARQGQGARREPAPPGGRLRAGLRRDAVPRARWSSATWTTREAPSSRLSESPRAFRLLEELGTRPKVIYLSKGEWGGRV